MSQFEFASSATYLLLPDDDSEVESDATERVTASLEHVPACRSRGLAAAAAAAMLLLGLLTANVADAKFGLVT